MHGPLTEKGWAGSVTEREDSRTGTLRGSKELNGADSWRDRHGQIKRIIFKSLDLILKEMDGHIVNFIHSFSQPADQPFP